MEQGGVVLNILKTLALRFHLQLGPFLRSLWELFHPRLSEPSVPAHHNKQALLAFWYHATNDCPENAQIMTNSAEITRNIAFNYIL